MGHCKRTGENDERAIRFGCHPLDGILKIGSATHGKRNYLHPRRQGPFKVRELPLHGICRIINDPNADCTRRYFPEHLSPFGSKAVLPEGNPRNGAPRSRYAFDQAGRDGIAHLREHGRHGAGSPMQRHRGRLIAGENSIRAHPYEFGSEASQALVISAWPALLDVDIATFDPPEILQAPAERRHAELAFGVLLRQPRNQHADALHALALLRPRRQRPSGRRAAEKGDELAASHCPMPPVLPTERIAHLGTADCCIHPHGRNEMIAITPPKIFSKEVAENRPLHFPARTSSPPEIVSDQISGDGAWMNFRFSRALPPGARTRPR